MQKLWRKISPVGPHKGVEIGMDAELLEQLDIFQWFKDGTVQFVSEIDFTFDPIAKLEPQDTIMDLPCVH